MRTTVSSKGIQNKLIHGEPSLLSSLYISNLLSQRKFIKRTSVLRALLAEQRKLVSLALDATAMEMKFASPEE